MISITQGVEQLKRQLDSALQDYCEVYDAAPWPLSTKCVDYLDGQTEALAAAIALLRGTSAPRELNESRDRLAARDRQPAAAVAS